MPPASPTLATAKEVVNMLNLICLCLIIGALVAIYYCIMGTTGFHLIVYDGTSTSTTVNGDLSAATDPVFTQRNSHITFTDDIKLLAVEVLGQNPVRATVRAPTWDAQTIFNVDPLNASSLQSSPPRVMNLFKLQPNLLTLPQDEEIKCQVTQGTQIAADTVTFGLMVGPTGWNRNLPKGIGPLSMFCARVTTVPTLLNRAFSTLVTMTFEQGLRAGWYAVLGSHWTQANGYFARMQFPRSTLYKQRALRPGYVISNAVGDLPWYQYGDMFDPLGVGGNFHTFELPQMEYWTQSTATPTMEGRLFLAKLSESTDPGVQGA